MRCPICKQGETRPGKTTVTLHQAETVLMVRHVPAEVCQNCGEVYLSEEVAQELSDEAQEVSLKGVLLHVREYVSPVSS